MFSKVVAVVSFATLAAATAVSQCNTGSAFCCNTAQRTDGKSESEVLALLGVVVQDVAAAADLGCTPIALIGAAEGANCAQQPVCCENNKFNGLVNVGCNPISL